MTVKVEIKGAKELADKLYRIIKESEAKDNWNVEVGYTKHYAVFVHENLTAWHAEGTQAKYLEEPFRKNQKFLMGLVIAGYKRLKSLKTALTLSGLYLQRLSQQIVPVDTGDLRASAYTRAFKNPTAGSTSSAGSLEANPVPKPRLRDARGRFIKQK